MAVLKHAVKEFTGSRIPNPQDSSPTARGQKLAIGTVIHARRRDLVFPFQLANLRAVVGVPDGSRPISAVGDQVPAVRTEGHCVAQAPVLPGRSRAAKNFLASK